MISTGCGLTGLAVTPISSPMAQDNMMITWHRSAGDTWYGRIVRQNTFML
jgi:hypothetical protein